MFVRFVGKKTKKKQMSHLQDASPRSATLPKRNHRQMSTSNTMFKTLNTFTNCFRLPRTSVLRICAGRWVVLRTFCACAQEVPRSVLWKDDEGGIQVMFREDIMDHLTDATLGAAQLTHRTLQPHTQLRTYASLQQKIRSSASTNSEKRKIKKEMTVTATTCVQSTNSSPSEADKSAEAEFHRACGDAFESMLSVQPFSPLP